MCRANKAEIDVHIYAATYPLYLTIFKCAQEFGLQGKWHIANLVQK